MYFKKKLISLFYRNNFAKETENECNGNNRGRGI